MKDVLLKELLKLKNKKHVDGDIYQKYLDRLKSGKDLYRYQGTADHFCVFFLPIHKTTRSVYLGDHIKGGDWMPPGGHIEKNEKPTDTVKREFKEELDFSLTNQKIILFDITIKPIDKPNHPCKLHWDLWYLIEMANKVNFAYCQREYYDAGWFPVKTAALKILHNPDYRNTILKLVKMWDILNFARTFFERN